jgi:hypothetical protein
VRKIIILVATALVAVVLAVVLLGSGDDTPGTEATTTTAPPARRAASTVGTPVDVGVRPTALTIAGGRVWSLSVRPGELDIVDPQTNQRVKAIRSIGDGGMSLTGAFHSVWVVKGGRSRTLERRDVSSGRRRGPVTAIA